jgi:MFS transporter, ACS family, glucarate transporter
MKQRYGVLGLLTSLAVLTYLDRLCISALGPTMQKELNLSPVQWGWIGAAFTLAYGGLEIPAGGLGDRFGRRNVILRIVLWWSAFTALTGAVSSFWLLVVVRFLFGAGEAGAFPNISGCASRWFPTRERARVQGLIWGASRIGAIIAPPLVFFIAGLFDNWRAAFWVFGAVGIMWALVWYVFYRDNPAEHPRITTAELNEIGARGGLDHRAVPWGRLFRSPQIWLVMCMYSSYVWGSTFYLYWLHTYLVKGRGFSEDQMKWYSTLPFVLGAMANPIGGVLSDLLSRRAGLKLGRRIMGSTCLAVGALFLLATSLTTGRTSGIVLLSLGFGALDMMLPSAWAVCMDIGGKYAGAVSGAMNSFGHIGGSLCTSLFGYLVMTSGSYNVPLLVIAANVALAAVLFAFIDASKPLVADEADASNAPVLDAPLVEANPCA